ncbi:Protein DGS1, mitochondrial [Porphyridium purpureum]|uniref:Protein DGS1, mitochondrial n=1 Tax=Porphyridium purpureum TaxID=35688 RepID=A0A5J4YLG8_PORPP|nr:Protein DGS1, mitochondrial [Porphyridium purpureum]|eukprot:POR6423..scf291_13
MANLIIGVPLVLVQRMLTLLPGIDFGKGARAVQANVPGYAQGDYKPPNLGGTKWFGATAESMPIAGCSRAQVQQLAQRIYTEILLSLTASQGAELSVADTQSLLAAVQAWHWSIEVMQMLSFFIAIKLHAVMNNLAYWQIVSTSATRCRTALYIDQGPLHFLGLFVGRPTLAVAQTFGRLMTRRRRKRSSDVHPYNAQRFVYEKLVTCAHLRQNLLIALALLHSEAAKLLGFGIASKAQHASRSLVRSTVDQRRTQASYAAGREDGSGRVVGGGNPSGAPLTLDETIAAMTGEDQALSSENEGTSDVESDASRVNQLIRTRSSLYRVSGVFGNDTGNEPDVRGVELDALMGQVSKSISQVRKIWTMHVNSHREWKTVQAGPRSGESGDEAAIEGDNDSLAQPEERATLEDNATVMQERRLAEKVKLVRQDVDALLREFQRRGPEKDLDRLVAQTGRPNVLLRNWPSLLLGAAAAVKSGAILTRWVMTGEAWAWAQSVKVAAETGWRVNVVGPVLNLLKEFGKPFQKQEVVSEADLLLEQEALHRMLEDYVRSLGGKYKHWNCDPRHLGWGAFFFPWIREPERHLKPGEPYLSPEKAQEAINILMQQYEKQLRHPIQSALFGKLSRSIFVQVQKGKADMSAALLSLDRILAANELTFTFAAAVPALLVLGILLWTLKSVFNSLLFRGHHVPKGAATLQLRLSLIEVSRSLETLEPETENLQRIWQSADGTRAPAPDAGAGENEDVDSDVERDVSTLASLEKYGQFIYRVDRVWHVGCGVFRLGEVGAFTVEVAGTSEWKSLQVDLAHLLDPRQSLQSKRFLLDRMPNFYESLRN